MYKIWFKEGLGMDHEEIMAECATVEIARKLWQTLHDAGYWMLCTKP